MLTSLQAGVAPGPAPGRAGIKKVRAGDAIAIAIVAALAVMSLMPLYWMVVTAFKQPTLVMKMPPEWLPKPLSLANFRDLLARQLLGRWTLNSAIVATAVTGA